MIIGRTVRILGVLSVVLGLAGCQSLDDSWVNAMSDMGIASTPSGEQSADAPAVPENGPAVPDDASAADSPAVPAEAAPTAAPAIASAQSGTETWCADVAAQARDRAKSEGYDETSVERRYAVAFRQCLGVVGAGR
jgi:hypothetical protein